MDNRDKTKFAELIYGLSEEFGGSVTRNGVKLKFKALEDFTIENITNAATWLAKHRKEKFPPVPTSKEFRDAIMITSGVLDLEGRANLEADKVFKKLREWGREALPLFHDDITKYLLTYRWTFKQIADSKEDELKWFRKEFIEAYKNSSGQERAFIDTTENAGMIPAKNLNNLITEK